MKHRVKLSSEQQQEHAAEQSSHQQQGAHEFASPEELLRFDAANTRVPPAVARRLEETINTPAPRPQSWWRRLLGRSKS